MKFFIDTANVEQIREAKDWGILDGVTTNPTLVAKEECDFGSVAKEILSLVDGPVSLEAVSTDAEGMVKEARELSKMGDNVVVKIPMTPDGIRAVKQLSSEGVKTNVTLIFSANQALIAAKAGATYVSPFLGRLDDQGWDGLMLVEDIMEVYRNYGFETEVIAASIRHPIHVIECAKMGCHIATVPYGVLKKMFKHTLTDKGVRAFLKDWEKVQEKCKKK
ncbi:MAG: fructose-6-phosphate aldolase [Candidatus Altiarchaeales archaeon]|nr:fructose-6-phosphate aldolase [Candidatus Altiarchaeales archaeon]MBD3415655.1 fructose-6-phosphate aldolase [Candidatus Altiarchaeales archaeon]